MDDDRGLVFKAWNVAAKSLQLHEMGRFEVSKYTLGPTVEGAIESCVEKWFGDTPARREAFRDVPEDVQAATKRRAAIQLLCLPEDFCMEVVTDPNTTLNMEMELLEVQEHVDVSGDGRQLLHVVREGKKRTKGVPLVTDLSTVTVHYRIAKLLLNFSLKDTRMGLASTSDGLVMREDKTKEPAEFVVGEEDAGAEGDFVPPCIGRCLMIPPGGVVEGMQYELILRDGVPISSIEKSISAAYEGGLLDAMPDTTGPVVIRIEVEKVVPPLMGPSTEGWSGVQSLRQERERAEELQRLEDGRHKQKALKRWRRVIAWLEQILEGRRWKLQGGPAAAGGSMYDLEWENDGEAGGEGEAKPEEQAEKPANAGAAAREGALPSLLEVEDELVRQLEPEELCEWATAHAAAAELLADGDRGLCEKHARCVVQAARLGQIAKEVEISGRSQLAARLMEGGNSAEALELLKAAQALDPTSSLLRDQSAVALQKDNDRVSVDMKEALRRLKQEIGAGLEAGDVPGVLARLEEVEGLPLTWDAVHETAIGKEVGKCSKHADAQVADHAKAIIATLHRLAKQQRPMWVR